MPSKNENELVDLNCTPLLKIPFDTNIPFISSSSSEQTTGRFVIGLITSNRFRFSKLKTK